MHKLSVKRTANAIWHAHPIGYYGATEEMIPSAIDRPMFKDGEPIVYTVMRPCRQCPRVKQERETEEIERLGGGIEYIENCCPMGKGDNGGCTATAPPTHNNVYKGELCSSNAGGGSSRGGSAAAAAASGGKKRTNAFEQDLERAKTKIMRLEREIKALEAQLAAKQMPPPFEKAVFGLAGAVGFPCPSGPIPDPPGVADILPLADTFHLKDRLESKEGSIVIRMHVQYSSKKDVPVEAQRFLAALWRDKLGQVRIQPPLPTDPAITVDGVEVVPIVLHDGIHAFEISIRVTHINGQEAEFKSAKHHDVVNAIDINSVFKEVKQIIANETKLFGPYVPLTQPSGGGGVALENTENMDTFKILTAVRELQSQSGNGLVKTLLIAQALGKKTTKEINPALYKLQDNGFLVKVTEAPPDWKLGARGVALLNKKVAAVATPTFAKYKTWTVEYWKQVYAANEYAVKLEKRVRKLKEALEGVGRVRSRQACEDASSSDDGDYSSGDEDAALAQTTTPASGLREETLRPYQQDLFDEAVADDGNVVVKLPTGAGKTRVAFEVMATALQRHPQRAIVFICPNVNLCVQQCKYFREYLLAVAPALSGVRVHEAAGSSSKTGKHALMRLGITGSACGGNVIFATAGTFQNFVLGGSLEGRTGVDPGARGATTFSKLSLLILDECHHVIRLQNSGARGETSHNYADITRVYSCQDPAARPKLLGLSASPGESSQDVEKMLVAMAARLLLVPPESRGLQTSSTETIPHLLASSTAGALHGFLIDLIEAAKDAQRAEDFDRVRDIINAMALFRTIGWGAFLIELLSATGRAIPFGVDFDEINSNAVAMLVGASGGKSPVLEAVQERLGAKIRQGNDFRAIIFVPTVPTAYAMCQALKPLVKAGMLVGQSEQTKARQTNAVEEFHAGKFNVLVATSVAEEGLDIQKCNLVIRTEKPQTIITSIQSRGRARQDDAEYIIMCLPQQFWARKRKRSKSGEIEYHNTTEEALVKDLATIEKQVEETMQRMLTSGGADKRRPNGGTNWSSASLDADASDHESGDSSCELHDSGGSHLQAAAHVGDDVEVSLRQSRVTEEELNMIDFIRGLSSDAISFEGSDDSVSSMSKGVKAQAAAAGGGRRDRAINYETRVDYKSKLNLVMQSGGRTGVAQYTQISVSGPPHRRLFVQQVAVEGLMFEGEPKATKKEAAQSAAFKALTKLDML